MLESTSMREIARAADYRKSCPTASGSLDQTAAVHCARINPRSVPIPGQTASNLDPAWSAPLRADRRGCENWTTIWTGL